MIDVPSSSVDFDAIWRYQDEVRTVVNACLGDCIWDLNYDSIRQCIELELGRHLNDEEQEMLSSQLTLPADYDGEGDNGSVFVIYL